MTLYLLRILVAAMLLLALCACTMNRIFPLSEKNNSSSLDTWVDQELAPYLVDQLTRQPLFKNEPVLLIAMRDADISPQIDSLTRTVRGRLLDQLLLAPGADLSWQPPLHLLEHHRRPDSFSCNTTNVARYFIGIDISMMSAETAQVRVRALDIGARQWVTGFGKTWRGRLTRAQQLAFKQQRTDEYTKGLRALPFLDNESDLLAEYVAKNMVCLLRNDQLPDVPVTLKPGVSDQPELNRVLTLIAHNFTRHQKPGNQIAAKNAILELNGSLTQIDRDLHQLWVTFRFSKDESERGQIETSAYILLDESDHSLTTESLSDLSLTGNTGYERIVSPDLAGDTGARKLSSLRVYSAPDTGQCLMYNDREIHPPAVVNHDECFEIEYDLYAPARVLILRHTPRGTLQELPATGCLMPDDSQWMSPQKNIRITGLSQPAGRRSTRLTGVESIYALAVTDPELVREIELHMRHLPGGCSTDNAESLSDEYELAWLEQLDALIEQYDSEVEWQSVSIRRGGF